jgi:hypothetical protein
MLPQDWRSLLDQCDLPLAATLIREMLAKSEAEAKAQGGSYYWQPQIYGALEAFIANPSRDTAIVLMDVTPLFWSYFDGCLPGGIWTFYRDMGTI